MSSLTSVFRVLKALWAPASIIILGLVLLALGWPILGAPLVLFGALDAHGRYRDYRWLWEASQCTRCVPGRGTHPVVVSTSNFVYFGRSFCGRQVVCAVDPTCRDDYLDHGYRWYHLLPDGFPRVLKKKQFWINMMGGHAASRRISD